MFEPVECAKIVNRKFEEAEFEWEISEYSSVSELFNERDMVSPVFSFADDPWYFTLKSKASAAEPGFMNLYLANKNDCDYVVQYTCGLKKQDGNMVYLSNGIWKQDHVANCMIVEFNEVEARKYELTPQDVLTFTCILKRETPQRTETDQSEFKKLMKVNTLSDNFRSLFANKGSWDKTLIVQEKEYKAHKAVLVARSSVFAAMFQNDTLEKQTEIVTIPDCDSHTFQQFLEFLYCGKLEKISFSSALQLYKTSDKYRLEELKTFCVDYLVENMTEENFREVVIMADKYGDARLFSAVQDLFNKDLSKIVDTSDWKCLLENNRDLTDQLLKGMSARLNALNLK